jgi:exopolysaccharide biosynthesis polyprenyl glycosylphosphotransferase
MLRRDRQIRTQIHQLLDAFLFASGFCAAFALRANPQITAWLDLDVIPPDTFNNVVWLIIPLMIAAPLVLESQGFYNRPATGSRAAIWWPLFKGCLITTVGLALVTYALHLVVPRGVATFFGCISFGLVYAKEELLRLVVRSKLAQAQSKRRFILVGVEKEIAQLRGELQQRTDDDIEIVAELDLKQMSSQELVHLLHEHSVYGVILNGRHAYFEHVESVVKACELEGVEVWLVADFFGTRISRTSLDELLGRPLLVFRTTPEASWEGLAKQLMDFFGALFLLAVALLPMAVIALSIKLTSRGPALFRQKRSGHNGAPFTLYKFRTMVTNAEQFKHELEAMNEMTGPVFKVTNDPRVTRLGKFLRRYSLDELPQLWNVLRGEMSLVGPRPLPVDEVKRFNDFAHRRRLSVKPGLTCLWQVKGRNEISDFKDWVRLDLEYIDNWSLWLDLKILLLTGPAVLRGAGAK